MPGKFLNLCAFSRTLAISLYRCHCTSFESCWNLGKIVVLKLLIQGLLWVWVLPMTNDVIMQCTSLVVTSHTQNDPSYTNINGTSRTNFETILSETLVVIHWYSVSFCLWLGMFVFTDLRWPRVFRRATPLLFYLFSWGWGSCLEKPMNRC